MTSPCGLWTLPHHQSNTGTAVILLLPESPGRSWRPERPGHPPVAQDLATQRSARSRYESDAWESLQSLGSRERAGGDAYGSRGRRRLQVAYGVASGAGLGPVGRTSQRSDPRARVTRVTPGNLTSHSGHVSAREATLAGRLRRRVRSGTRTGGVGPRNAAIRALALRE